MKLTFRRIFDSMLLMKRQADALLVIPSVKRRRKETAMIDSAYREMVKTFETMDSRHDLSQELSENEYDNLQAECDRLFYKFVGTTGIKEADVPSGVTQAPTKRTPW